MKFFCVADEDTVRGFRLAGVEGEAVATAAEADQAIRRAAQRPDLGILIVTDTVAADVRELVDDVRMNRDRPLIVEIPGPQGPMPGRKTLRQLVQEAVGIRIGQEESSA
ncbi:MAG TPA: V-type ATP synthase subunit F [Phycisphaerae bacterium]|nr:V-type ATP synthase subunit F [Phycisphaerae bacterium]